MVIIRCTQKLLRRVGSPEPATVSSTTRLGDWYANLLGVGHQRFMLCVSERGRLPVLLRAQDVKHFSRHLPAAVGAVLAGLGVAPSSIKAEFAEMQQVTLAATASRSVLGSLNDFSKSVRWRLRDEPDADLLDVALWLAETPILVLDGKSPNILAPALLGLTALSRK